MLAVAVIRSKPAAVNVSGASTTPDDAAMRRVAVAVNVSSASLVVTLPT